MPERIFNKIKEIGLEPEDKVHMRSVLSDFMQQNSDKQAEVENASLLSPFSSLVRDYKAGRLVRVRKNNKAFGQTRIDNKAVMQGLVPSSNLFGPLSIFKQKKFMPIIIALILLLGGGTTYAANGSLPGDSLYPVKIHVNENVESFLAFNSETQAKVNVNQATRRLEEAEKLASKGTLTATAQADLEARFNQKSTDIAESVTRLNAKGETSKAAELSSEFESSLRAHQRIIASLALKADNNNGSQVAINAILGAVERKLARTAESRVEAEVVISTSSDQAKLRASTEKALAASQKEIDQIRNSLNKSNTKVSAESRAAFEARLADADRLMLEGKAKIEANLLGDAFVAFKDAQRIAHEVSVLAKAQGNSRSSSTINFSIGSFNSATSSNGNADFTATTSVSASSSSDAKVKNNSNPNNDSDTGSVTGNVNVNASVQSDVSVPNPAIVLPEVTATGETEVKKELKGLFR